MSTLCFKLSRKTGEALNRVLQLVLLGALSEKDKVLLRANMSLGLHCAYDE